MSPSQKTSPAVPPPITPYSELGTPPEKFVWWTPIGRLFAILMTAITAGVLILLSPLIGLLTLIRRVVFRNPKYHTQPKDLRVAIIGGGWSGLQCMARFHELGVEHVKGFERYDSVGGTWHPKLRYHSIQIHGAMWVTSFSNYPYNSQDQDKNDGKASGEETLQYMKRFMNDKGLAPNYSLNSKVETVKYNSSTRQATLVVQEGSKQREEGPFDLVIYAAQASERNIPCIPGMSDFKGDIIHSIDFDKAKYETIVQNNKKVAVVGGSKAACDLTLCLHRSGHTNFQWLVGKPYVFWKYEYTFHDRSLINALRGASTLVAVMWSLISKTICGWMLWGSGLGVTYGKPHNDWSKFHFGILCPRQRHDLSTIPAENQVNGYPRKFLADGLEMKDGQVVKADCVLFGTGCQSGIDKLSFEKDGKPYVLDANTRMLNYFITPDFPVLCNSTALWTTFGPVRAVNSADMAVYHMCVRRKLTEEEMKQMANRQLGGSTNSVSGWLFQSEAFALRVWLIMYIDLMLSGIVDFFDFVYHALEMFVLARQSALKFRVLPESGTGGKQTSSLTSPLITANANATH